MQILVINALNGVFPLVLQKKYPHAKITCAEVFPFYKHHLANLGFEVVDWDDVDNMKFDMIVGNPPYQDTSKTEKGGSTLWSMFIKRSMELVKPNGYVAMVTPNAWMSFGKSGAPMKGKQIHHVWTQSGKHFPGIGSTFSSWILQNTPTHKATVFQDERVEIDLREHQQLPVGRPLAGLHVVEKIKNWPGEKLNPQIEIKIKVSYSERNNLFTGAAQATKNNKFCYEVFHTNSKTYFTSEMPSDYHIPKVIISTSSPKPTYYGTPMGCATGDLRSYILVQTDQEGNNLVDLLNSKLYRFVWRKPGMISYKDLRLPKLDLTKKWSDSELYSYFNLTPEQIETVEAHK